MIVKRMTAADSIVRLALSYPRHARHVGRGAMKRPALVERLHVGQEDRDMIRSLVITAASIAALVAPAQASALGNNSMGSVTVHSGSHGSSNWRGGGHHFGGLACDSRRDRDRRGRGGSGCAVFADSWGY